MNNLISLFKLAKLLPKTIELYLDFKARGNYIIWPWEYGALLNQLAKIVEKSNFRPTCLIEIPRGGAGPADRLSRLFSIPIAYAPACSYPDTATKPNSKIQYSRHLAATWPPRDDAKYYARPLIIDDFFETGRTLKIVRKVLFTDKKRFVKQARTAVLIVKVPPADLAMRTEIAAVDFYVEKLPINTWILQPPEWYGPDKITLENL